MSNLVLHQLFADISIDKSKLKPALDIMTQAQRDDFLKNLGHAVLSRALNNETDVVSMVNIRITTDNYHDLGVMPEITAAYFAARELRVQPGERWMGSVDQRYDTARKAMSDVWACTGRPFVMGTSYSNGKLSWHS